MHVVLATMERGAGRAYEGDASALADAFAEDALLARALAREGVAATSVPWTRQDDAAWASADACLIKSTWDYHDDVAFFLAWTRRVAARMALWNGADVVAWNADKSYLRDLDDRGVAIPPTAFFARGARVDLAALVAERAWSSFVVKPAVGASSEGQWRGPRDRMPDAQRHLDALLEKGGALVQPFLESIVRQGETSIVLFDGAYSHAVRKVPKAGDHRANPVLGARIERVTPSDGDIKLAERALAAAKRPTLHARVDLVTLPDGRSAVMELELIEPLLFLAHADGAAERLARCIRARL